MDDKALKKLVEAELDWEPSIDAADIAVTVDKGIVHLGGRVATYAQKVTAENAVKRVKGVRGFVQDLDVRPFPEVSTDQSIAMRVVNLLDWDVTVPKDTITVKVENGFVTLTGQVDWQYQRTAAERGARNLPGVRGLNNQIQVKPKLTARDVKQRIEDALERQAELDAQRIVVTVDGDEVRLEGKVKAWFEREIAEQAVWAAPGVRKVDDRVSIGL